MTLPPNDIPAAIALAHEICNQILQQYPPHNPDGILTHKARDFSDWRIILWSVLWFPIRILAFEFRVFNVHIQHLAV